MYFLALRLLRSKDEAKDVVQDVFLKLWERKKDMPLYKNTECYVMKMVRNICLDRLKNKHSGLEPITNDCFSDSQNIEKSIENRDTVANLRRIIDNMLPKYREVIQLREIEQYSFDEIEQITGYTKNNIRTILSRSRKQIKEKMSKLNNYGIQ